MFAWTSSPHSENFLPGIFTGFPVPASCVPAISGICRAGENLRHISCQASGEQARQAHDYVAGTLRDHSTIGAMRGPLLLSTLLLLGALAPAAAQTTTPAETARAMLRQYQEDPARIDRARDLLEAHVARGGVADVPTLLALARAWFLFGEERAKTVADKIAAYARARDYAKRATELAPNNADAHLWHAITLGTWSQAKGLLSSALALRDLRKEVDIVLRLDPNNIEAHIMAGSIARELPVVLGGSAKEAEEHFKTAQRLDPKLTGVRIELAQLYINTGRFPEARQQLQSVLAERAPTDRPRWTLKETPRARQMLESIRDKK